MIFLRTKFANSYEGKKYPWIFKCREPGCYHTVAARSWVGANKKRTDHRNGKSPCPRIGPSYQNRQLVSKQTVA